VVLLACAGGKFFFFFRKAYPRTLFSGCFFQPVPLRFFVFSPSHTWHPHFWACVPRDVCASGLISFWFLHLSSFYLFPLSCGPIILPLLDHFRTVFWPMTPQPFLLRAHWSPHPFSFCNTGLVSNGCFFFLPFCWCIELPPAVGFHPVPVHNEYRQFSDLSYVSLPALFPLLKSALPLFFLSPFQPHFSRVAWRVNQRPR